MIEIQNTDAAVRIEHCGSQNHPLDSPCNEEDEMWSCMRAAEIANALEESSEDDSANL